MWALPLPSPSDVGVQGHEAPSLPQAARSGNQSSSWKPVSLLPALPARCPSPTVQPLLSCLRLPGICGFKIDRQGGMLLSYSAATSPACSLRSSKSFPCSNRNHTTCAGTFSTEPKEHSEFRKASQNTTAAERV